MGPLGIQGLSLGPKPGETVVNFVRHFDPNLIVFQICVFPVVFGVVLRRALGTLFGPKGCPSGAKGSVQGKTEVTWVHFGTHFGDAGETKRNSEI